MAGNAFVLAPSAGPGCGYLSIYCSRVKPPGFRGPPWKKNCLGPHLEYTHTDDS